MKTTIWMGIAPGSLTTRVIAMAGASETILKARLAPEPHHPRALPTLLEAIALWQGRHVRAALAADERGEGSDSSLFRAVVPDDGGALFTLRGGSMISAELRARIRRLFFAEHWKMGTIAAELGVHHDTVALAVEPERFINVAYRPAATRLDPYKDFVRRTLEQHPRLRATRLLQMVQARGYAGSIWAPPTLRAPRSTDRGTRGVLSSVDFAWRASPGCRAIFARFVLDQTMESFLRCHVAAFEFFQGIPRELLYDNLKSVVLERIGDVIVFHPRLLELAGHYHFAPKPVAPARCNEKGRVERAIRYLRDSFFAARSFRSLDDLNVQLAEWTERVAHARLVPGDTHKRTVAEALAEERSRLLSLPVLPLHCDSVQAIRSGKTPYLRFDSNDYSIPTRLWENH
jgi:hypothetical protein